MPLLSLDNDTAKRSVMAATAVVAVSSFHFDAHCVSEDLMKWPGHTALHIHLC